MLLNYDMRGLYQMITHIAIVGHERKAPRPDGVSRRNSLLEKLPKVNTYELKALLFL